MAFEIKLSVLIDQAAEVIWVYDKTLAYDATQNSTGWGDPNPELSESCLFIYAEQVIDSGNVVIAPITSQFIYDNAAANTAIKEFQLTYNEDGEYHITLLQVGASTDGVNFESGSAIAEGEYVYYSGALYQMVSSALVEVIDLSGLIGDENVNQTTCETLLTASANIKASKLRLAYTTERDDDNIDIDEKRNSLIDLEQDIASAHYAFRTNKRLIAKETVNRIHEKYE